MFINTKFILEGQKESNMLWNAITGQVQEHKC